MYVITFIDLMVPFLVLKACYEHQLDAKGVKIIGPSTTSFVRLLYLLLRKGGAKMSAFVYVNLNLSLSLSNYALELSVYSPPASCRAIALTLSNMSRTLMCH